VKLKNVRTFKADDLFPLEYRIWASGVGKTKLPIKNDEESSLVAEGGFEPPTFGL
jgi:hypothetical protein